MKIKIELEIDTIEDRTEIEDFFKLVSDFKKKWDLVKEQKDETSTQKK